MLHTLVPNNSCGTGQATGNTTTAATQGALQKNGAGGATAGGSTGAGGSRMNIVGGGGVGPGEGSNSYPTSGGRMTRGGGGGVGPREGSYNNGHDRGHDRGGAWSNGGSNPDNRRVLMHNRFEQLGNNSDSDGNMQENFPPYNPNDKWHSVKNKGTGKNSNYSKKTGYM